MSTRTQDDQRLLQKIIAIYEKSESRYGSPRVFKALVAQAIQVGRKRTIRIEVVNLLEGGFNQCSVNMN
jgi:hypothetical protein